MLAPGVVIRGIVERLLPPKRPDNSEIDVPARYAPDKSIFVRSRIRKQYGLIDEGSYFLTHNAQTAIVTALLGAAFAETTISPVMFIGNTDGQGGRTINLDYLNLVATVAGAAGAALTNLLFAWSLDVIGRYTSGGTDLTAGPASGGGVLNANMAVSKRASVAQVYFGALTLAAATAARRIIVPQRQLRQQNSATVMCVAQDHFHMNFAGVEEAGAETDISTAKTVALQKVFALPGIQVPPGMAAILHMWSPGAALTTGITFLPEMAHWEE